MAVESPGLVHREGYLLVRLLGGDLFGDFCLHRIANTVCPPLAARASVYLSGHMAALGSNWCCVRKRGMGTGLPVQHVPQNAIVILLILFGYNPFEIIAHMK